MAFSNITVNDGASTPVATTFTPTIMTPNGVQWFEQTSPAPANGQVARKLSIGISRGISPSSTELNTKARAQVKLYQPTGETLAPNSSGITPPPREAYRNVATLEFELPERGTVRERDDLRSLSMNLLNHPQVISVIENLRVPS